jgi:hypothetical protein
MNTKFNSISLFVALLFLAVGFTSCGSKKAKVPDAGLKLMSTAWKYDVNANLKKGSESTENATGVSSDIQLQGDVGAMANFVAETLTFGRDSNDETKLSYSKKIGEGLLSSSVIGYWSMSDDGKTITLRQWDNAAGKEKDPVNYTIVELTDDKLVLMKAGEDTKKIYKKK